VEGGRSHKQERGPLRPLLLPPRKAQACRAATSSLSSSLTSSLTPPATFSLGEVGGVRRVRGASFVLGRKTRREIGPVFVGAGVEPAGAVREAARDDDDDNDDDDNDALPFPQQLVEEGQPQVRVRRRERLQRLLPSLALARTSSAGKGRKKGRKKGLRPRMLTGYVYIHQHRRRVTGARTVVVRGGRSNECCRRPPYVLLPTDRWLVFSVGCDSLFIAHHLDERMYCSTYISTYIRTRTHKCAPFSAASTAFFMLQSKRKRKSILVV